MKCKNIECENETIGKRVYCSLSCRNIFVNKYLRNYDKVSDAFNQKKKKKEEEYLKSPNCCKECNQIIPFDKIHDNIIFCSGSCRTSYNNRDREVTWGDKISAGINRYIDENGYFGAMLNKKQIPIKECPNCKSTFQKKTKYCGNRCRRIYERDKMNEYQKYRLDSNFKFNLADFPDEFDFSLITEHGWYSPTNKNNNLSGVSRDHMFSVRDGFERSIDPKLISHPANCRLILHTDNISKNKKSIITIEELLERIKKFEDKYMKKLDA